MVKKPRKYKAHSERTNIEVISCNIKPKTHKILKEINILNGDSIKESIDKAVKVYIKTLKV